MQITAQSDRTISENDLASSIISYFADNQLPLTRDQIILTSRAITYALSDNKPTMTNAFQLPL